MLARGLIAGKVVHRVDWTRDLFSITVSTPFLPFTAGQFTKLALKNKQGDWIRRAYSIVNHPSDDNSKSELEFLIIASENGLLSPRLQQLRVGDEIWVGEQAAGFMTANEIPAASKDLWLIASGTGIGPYLSMLTGACLPYEFIVLVHAVRTEQELVYQDLINTQLQRYAGRLKYVPVVSREQVSRALSGRVPALLRNGSLEQFASVTLDATKSFIYLCGNPEMVKESNKALIEKGLNKHLRRKLGNFSSENYW